jgi:hypothetical protein
MLSTHLKSLVALAMMFPPFGISTSIRITAENHLPLIATADHMVDRAENSSSVYFILQRQAV